MTNIKTFIFTIILLVTGCNSSKSTHKQRPGDRLLKDQELHTKDSPDILKHDSAVLYTGWYYVVDTPNGYKRQLDKSNEVYYLDPKPITTAKNVTTFEFYENSYNGKKHYGLTMRLDKDGTESWSYATRKAEVMGLQLAFIIDNKLLQVSKVNSQITGGVTNLNRVDYSHEELENFKTIINNEK
jgi:preprotein translocase subunit SecD